VRLLDLWPALILAVLPIPTGICGGFAADAWHVLRDLRAGRALDPTRAPVAPPTTDTNGGVKSRV
jgi:hypothetical protein